LQVFKDEKAIAQEREEKQDEFLTKTKRVVYPLYLIGAVVITLIWIGESQQARLIEENAKKLKLRDKLNNYV
jgi:hypothetical protein